MPGSHADTVSGSRAGTIVAFLAESSDFAESTDSRSSSLDSGKNLVWSAEFHEAFPEIGVRSDSALRAVEQR